MLDGQGYRVRGCSAGIFPLVDVRQLCDSWLSYIVRTVTIVIIVIIVISSSSPNIHRLPCRAVWSQKLPGFGNLSAHHVEDVWAIVWALWGGFYEDHFGGSHCPNSSKGVPQGIMQGSIIGFIQEVIKSLDSGSSAVNPLASQT